MTFHASALASPQSSRHPGACTGFIRYGIHSCVMSPRSHSRSTAPLRRVFLLSPARVDGVRAGYLLNPTAEFALARRFHAEGLPLAEIFAFTSGLYFRGKITYARRFARPEG